MTPTLARIGAVVFVSGFCSLVYQVAWLRLLRLVFGSSTAATAAVLAIFMGGLGLGGALLGRRAERSPEPLAFYARLELGIAATAALSPLLVALVRQLYLGLGGSTTLGAPGATLLRLGLATLVLGVPTTLMGGTLPAVAQALERAADRGRRRVATLYGVNTLGAVTGAFLTTFVMIERFGVRRSLWLAALVNVLLALIVSAMARRAEPESALPEPLPAAAESAGELHAGSRRLVLAAAGIVGFIFFLMELVWYRMLAPVLGGSAYTFGLILAVALLGIGAGGALYGRGAERRRPTLHALAVTCVAEALCLVAPYALGDDLALFAAVLRRFDVLGFGGLVAGWTAIVTIVVLPAAMVAGYQFPLLIALLGSGRRHVGSQVGLAYAWNTWGAVLGALAGGFVLLPVATAPRLWTASAALLAVLGGALAVLAWRRERRPRRLALVAAAALLALGLGTAPGPSAFWRHTAIGAGRLKLDFGGPNELRHRRHEVRRSLVAEAEGVESSVAMMEIDELALFVNGKSDGSARADAPTAVMSGLVGALVHGSPRRVLVIGLGTGETAGWLARVESVERVDVVELEPAVGRLAGAFAPVALDVLRNPKVHVHYGDGREYVLTTAQTYDLIFSEPSNPYRAGVADLFSRDFYRALADRLEPGGVFMQWLQGYEVDAGLVGLVYGTLASVFPHVESWQVNVLDLMLLSSREGRVHDLDRMRRDLAREPFRSALALTWRVEGLEGLYSGFLGGDALARHLAAAADVSTDDQPRIEFGFARTVGRTGLFNILDLQLLAQQLGADLPAARGAPLDPARIREARHARQVAVTFLELAPSGLPAGEEKRRAARAAWGDGDLRTAGDLWLSQEAPPELPLDRLLVAEALAERGDPRAAEHLAALAEPLAADLVTARLLWRRGDDAGAIERLAVGLERMRTDPWAVVPLARRSLALAERLGTRRPSAGARLADALAEPFAVLLLEETRKRSWLRLRSRLPTFPDRCAEVFAAFEPHVVWERAFLETRMLCYRAQRHPLAARAVRELRAFLAAAPPVLDGALRHGVGL